MNCPQCNRLTRPGERFCLFCGTPLPQERLMPACRVCGRPIKPEYSFCTGCGTPIPKEQREPEKPRCKACGRELKPEYAFCIGCGTPVEPPSSADMPPTYAAGSQAATEPVFPAFDQPEEPNGEPPAPEPPKERCCPQCGSVVGVGLRFCEECGCDVANTQPPEPMEPLPPEERRCPQCNSIVEVGLRFCEECGHKMED